MNLVPYDDNNLPKKADAENRKLPQVSRSLGKPVKNNNEKVVNNSSGKVVKSSSGKIESGSSGKVVKSSSGKVESVSSGKVAKNSSGKIVNRSSNQTSNRVTSNGGGNVVGCGDYSSDYNTESENIYNTNGGENEEAEGCCGCITLIVLILLILLIFNGCQRIGHAIFSPEKGNKPAVTKTIDENITTEKAFDKDFSNGY